MNISVLPSIQMNESGEILTKVDIEGFVLHIVGVNHVFSKRFFEDHIFSELWGHS